MTQVQAHTELSDEQKHLLEDLYAQVPLSVDGLPYTSELKEIHQEFVRQTGSTLTEGQVWFALKNLGRAGRLGGKFRTSAPKG
jgi:hypothetical protein